MRVGNAAAILDSLEERKRAAMPTYEYLCKACDHRFEVFQLITAEALRKCPECKKNRLQRIIGAGAAVIFKGSGFYQTDYRSESYKKAAADDKKASDGSGSSSDSKPKSDSSADKKGGGGGKSSD
jgi:putative FmdB family regulatory protein